MLAQQTVVRGVVRAFVCKPDITCGKLKAEKVATVSLEEVTRVLSPIPALIWCSRLHQDQTAAAF